MSPDLPDDFEARWRHRFERFGRTFDSEAQIAGWSSNGAFDGTLCFGVTQALSDSVALVRELVRVARLAVEVWVDGRNGLCLPDLARRLVGPRGFAWGSRARCTSSSTTCPTSSAMKPSGSAVATERTAIVSSERWSAGYPEFANACTSVLLPVCRAPCRKTMGVSLSDSRIH
ncbi:MAG: hypothetical protein L0H63_15860 [Nitrococcus sp.]|nr:hypothetical protein [Nitrococcus sp.]